MALIFDEIQGKVLKIGRDDDNHIDFSTDNTINFRVNANSELKLDAFQLYPSTNDGLKLGHASYQWSDLFLASGAVINFNNGDVTLTHSGNNLAISGGNLEFTGYGAQFADNAKIQLGASNDLQIYHDGTDNHIDATSALNLATGTSGVQVNIGHTTSEVVVNDNLTVTGDLTIVGDTIMQSTTNTTISDTIIRLNAGVSSGTANTYDTGLMFNRGSSDRVFFGWDESVDKFIMVTTSTAADAAAGNVAIANNEAYQTLVANIQAPVSATVGGNNVMTVAGGTMSGAIAMGNNNISGVANLFINAGNLSITGDGSHAVTLTQSGNGDFTIDAPDDIRLDAGGGDVVLRTGGTEYGRISSYSNNLRLTSSATNADIILQPNGTGKVDINSNVTLSGDNPTITLNDSNGRAAAIDVVGNTFRIDDVGNNAAIFTADLSTNPVQTTFAGPLSAGSNSLTAGSLDINGNADISGDLTMSGHKIVKFASTTYGAFDSEDFFRIKFQDVGGTHNDVGIGQTAANSLGFNITSGGSFLFNGGTSGNALTLTSGGNATFTGSVTATGGLIADTQFSYDNDSGNQPFYITRQGSTNEALSIKVTDSVVRFESIQDESLDDYGGFEFRMDSGTTEPDFVVRKGTGSPILNVRGDGNTTFAGHVTITGGSDIFLADNGKTHYGASNDLEVYHDGSNNYIVAKGTGDLILEQQRDDGDIIFKSDDGSGGTTEYFRLDGSLATHDGSATTAMYTVWQDDSIIALGTSRDLVMYHTGTSSFISNYTGNFYIDQNLDDGDIVFRCDDGSGGLTEYFRLDGGFSSPYTIFSDSSTLALGSNVDLRLFHDGSNSYIQANGTGDLIIVQDTDDGDIIFKSDNGSGGTATYFKLDGGNAQTEFERNVKFLDTIELRLGTSNDLRLYHDGTNSYIHNDTGDLRIENDNTDGDIIFRSDNGSGGLSTYFRVDGGLQKTIFPDNQKLAFGSVGDLDIFHNGTDSAITNATGHLYIKNEADDKDIIFQCDDQSGGTATYFFLDGSTTSELTTTFPDNSMAAFGTGNDLRLWHDGSTSYVNNYNGTFKFYQHVDDGDMIFYCDDGSGGATPYITLDGSATEILLAQTTKAQGTNLTVEPSSGGNGQLNVTRTSGATTFIQSQSAAGIIGTSSNHKLDIKTNSSTRLSIATSGDATFNHNVIVTGNITAPTRKLSKSGTTDGDYDGDVVYFGGTTSMEVGEIYYLTSSGTWALADADAEATAKGMLAVALGGSSDTDGMLVRGFVTLDHDPGTVGDTLFLSTTAGLATATAPSGNGDIIRVIGYCLDSTNGQIYFNPDGTFVEVSA